MDTLLGMPRKRIIAVKAGWVGLFLTSEMYFHQLIFGRTRQMYFRVMIAQLVIAVALGVTASLLHSRWWLIAALWSVATLGMLLVSLSV